MSSSLFGWLFGGGGVLRVSPRRLLAQPDSQKEDHTATALAAAAGFCRQRRFLPSDDSLEKKSWLLCLSIKKREFRKTMKNRGEIWIAAPLEFFLEWRSSLLSFFCGANWWDRRRRRLEVSSQISLLFGCPRPWQGVLEMRRRRGGRIPPPAPGLFIFCSLLAPKLCSFPFLATIVQILCFWFVVWNLFCVKFYLVVAQQIGPNCERRNGIDDCQFG